MSEALILNVRDLHAGYGRVPVLHGIDFSVSEGQIVGVLGHNGMGKTTLLKTLMGMVPATSGRIEFDGVDISDEPAYERSRLGLGYVPQGRGIFPQLSVYDNLRMGVVEHAEEEHEAIEAVIQEFPALQPLLDRSGEALSGGEQQILALARCLISKPDLVLLDEPTEGIQPSIIDGIIDLLKRLNTEQGLAIVLVEQNLEFVTSLSDRVLLLQKGDIIGEVGDGHSTESVLIEEFVGFGSGALMSNSTSHTEPTRENTPMVSQSLPTVPTGKERYTYMTVKRPTHEQLREITLDLGMHLSDERIIEFLDVMEDTMKVYDIVDAMPDYLPTVDYPRTPGYRPSSEENPLNAWYIKCEVKGAPRGPLA
ncbi:MAG TPA: ATP-binding cassette domain-containing protein, partial [Arenicellales bacterium]|nr:ATP-binding cassette domain-containing protein [Arenicellales bacterium]